MSHKNKHALDFGEWPGLSDEEVRKIPLIDRLYLREWHGISDTLYQILQTFKRLVPYNTGIILNIGGNKMGAPATITLGNPPVQSTAVETLNGTPTSTFNGPLAYASDNTAVATVDSASGLVTQVAVGVANISVTDAVGNLTDSVAVTVQASAPVLNNGIVLTVPSN